MNRFFFCFAMLVSFYSLRAQTDTASITVDARQVYGKVNPLIFGNNILAYQKGMWKYASPDYWDRGSGIWNSDLGCPDSEMAGLAKLAGITVVRWPGAQHYFDWKKTIGPVSQRPDQKFGLPEFMQFCFDINATPLITIPEFFGTARDAADLVEYLDAPDDGNHIWAKRRASDGHPDPWNVVWFEYGNETAGAHRNGGMMNAEEYAKNYLAYRQSMSSIDQRVKLGVVGTDGFPDLNKWFRPVLRTIGRNADFVIHHCYIPMYDGDGGIPRPTELFAISLACEAQIQRYYDEMNGVIDELSGSHIPIAVTEYNGHFTQEKPVEYRFTLGNALLNAEMIKIFLNPSNNIVMANSWQFSNEYWGAVKGYTYKHERLVKRPLFYVLQLYHEHFGTELVEANVKCDTYDTDGGFTVEPAKGDGRKFQLMPDAVTLPDKWQFSPGLNFSQWIEGDTLVVEFKGQDVNYFNAYKTFATDPSVSYRATAWIKTEGVTSTNGACIEFVDARGWTATKSAQASKGIGGTSNWQKVEVDYTPLPDTKKITIRARRTSGAGPISGRAYFRDVKVQKFIPEAFPAVPYLTVTSSRSILLADNGKGGKTKVYVMVVNKKLDSSISGRMNLLGMMPHRAKAWILTGPSVDATNELDPNNVSIQERDYGEIKNGFVVTFPSHSLTALEIE